MNSTKPKYTSTILEALLMLGGLAAVVVYAIPLIPDMVLLLTALAWAAILTPMLLMVYSHQMVKVRRERKKHKEIAL